MAQSSLRGLQPIIVIPARLAASRLPNKPLADIGGLPMIVHCLHRALEADIAEVLVAAGDQEIVDVVSDYGGTAVLTDPELPSGTDRIATALAQCDAKEKYNFVINFQGDLPLFDPKGFRYLLQDLSAEDRQVRTLVAVINNLDDVHSPAVVKVQAGFQDFVAGEVRRAISFSRNPIPHGEGAFLHHIGIYGYPSEILHQFVRLPESPLEKREKLEQMRLLENGFTIEAVLVDEIPISVDIPSDLERAVRLWQKQQV